jgi:hypothetical protein
MPTQSDFEWAAGEFERTAARLDELFAMPRRLLGMGVMIGGQLTADLHALFDRVGAALRSHADELLDLSITCRSRAVVCGEYRAQQAAYDEGRDRHEGEMRRWHAMAVAHDENPTASAPPGPPPVPPVAPADPPAWLSPGSA